MHNHRPPYDPTALGRIIVEGGGPTTATTLDGIATACDRLKTVALLIHTRLAPQRRGIETPPRPPVQPAPSVDRAAAVRGPSGGGPAGAKTLPRG